MTTLVTQSKLYVLSSLNASRKNGELNSDTLHFIEKINTAKDVHHISVQILNASVPNSMYLINEHNDKLDIYGTEDTSSISLLHGDYNINSFLTMLRSRLPEVWSVSYDARLGKITIVNDSYPFTILKNSTAWKIMGLSRDDDMVAVEDGEVWRLELPNRISFFPVQVINVKCSQLGVFNWNGVDNSSDTVLSIVNDAPSNGQITYQNDSLEYIVGQNVEYLNLRFTDPQNNLLDFNGNHWTMTLVFKFHYVKMPETMTFASVLRDNHKRKYDLLEQTIQDMDRDGF